VNRLWRPRKAPLRQGAGYGKKHGASGKVSSRHFVPLFTVVGKAYSVARKKQMA
jgi:hypothetical protein